MFLSLHAFDIAPEATQNLEEVLRDAKQREASERLSGSCQTGHNTQPHFSEQKVHVAPLALASHIRYLISEGQFLFCLSFQDCDNEQVTSFCFLISKGELLCKASKTLTLRLMRADVLFVFYLQCPAWCLSHCRCSINLC